MTWTFTAGESPKVSRGSVVTTTLFENGKDAFKQDVLYDGTRASWEASCAAVVAKSDPTTSKPVIVAPGTVATLSGPTDPTPPTDEELATAAFFADVYAERQQNKLKALSPELQARCKPEWLAALP